MQSTKAFIIFVVVATSIYALMNTYIYFRGFSALSGEGGRWVLWLKLSFLLIVLTFPVSIFLRNTSYCGLNNVLTIIGSVWVGAMTYFLLIAFAADVMILVGRLFPVVTERLSALRPAGRSVFFGSIVLVGLILFFGWINTLVIRVRPIEVVLPTLPKVHNPTTIIYLSDVHLGLIIHERRLETFVEKINAEHPDLIIIGGDLVDESVEGLDGMPETLAKLRAPLGIYAVLGNHEFYAGADKAVAFMESAGIRVLRNEVVTVPGLVNLMGIDDPTALRFGEKKLPSPAALMKQCDRSLPTILLFHPPIHVEEYSKTGVDLMLSGHTHHGQLFPANFITRMVYLLDYGFERVGPMQLNVSSGLGTWGPPVRVMTHPEIVRITLVTTSEAR